MLRTVRYGLKPKMKNQLKPKYLYLNCAQGYSGVTAGGAQKTVYSAGHLISIGHMQESIQTLCYLANSQMCFYLKNVDRANFVLSPSINAYMIFSGFQRRDVDNLGFNIVSSSKQQINELFRRTIPNTRDPFQNIQCGCEINLVLVYILTCKLLILCYKFPLLTCADLKY